MAVVVISGSSSGVGKTSVGCALIAAMPEFRWVAVKVTPHRHDLPEGIWDETDRDSSKDTGRYLAAGAKRASLVTGSVDELRVRIDGAEALLVESNRISASSLARPDEPAVSLAVLGGLAAQWKESLWECVNRVDALVLTGGFPPDQLPRELRHKRLFWMMPGRWSSPELVRFVRSRLLAKA